MLFRYYTCSLDVIDIELYDQVGDHKRLCLTDILVLVRDSNTQMECASNELVRQCVFRHTDDTSISLIIIKHQLWWIVRILRVLSQRVSHCAFFSDGETGFEKRSGGQFIT